MRILQTLLLVASTAHGSTALCKSPVTALAFAPSGDAIVIGSQAGIEVRAWPSLAEIESRASGATQIHDLKFSPDGEHLLVVGGAPSAYGEWRLLAWPTLREVASDTKHDDVIHAAAWLSVGRFVTGAADNQVIEWQWANGEVRERRRYVGHSRPVLCVEFLEKSQLLISAGVDQSVRVWDCAEIAPHAEREETEATSRSTPLRNLDNHTGVVCDLAARPGDHDVAYLASASADKTVRIWQPSIGRLVRFARLPVEPASIAWTRDGELLVVGCIDGKLRVVNPHSVKVEQEIDAFDGWIYEVTTADDGSFVAAGADGNVARVVVASRP